MCRRAVRVRGDDAVGRLGAGGPRVLVLRGRGRQRARRRADGRRRAGWSPPVRDADRRRPPRAVRQGRDRGRLRPAARPVEARSPTATPPTSRSGGSGYTTFSQGAPEMSRDATTCRSTVANVGDRTGSTVVFAFGGLRGIRRASRPLRRLIGFLRVDARRRCDRDGWPDRPRLVATRRASRRDWWTEPGEYAVDGGFRCVRCRPRRCAWSVDAPIASSPCASPT